MNETEKRFRDAVTARNANRGDERAEEALIRAWDAKTGTPENPTSQGFLLRLLDQARAALSWHSKDEKIARELRDASQALWNNVIQRSPIASYAVREHGERELDKILGRVHKAIVAYDERQR